MAKAIFILAALLGCTYAVPEVQINSGLDWRIIGGHNAKTGQFPFIVSLRKYSHSCGGSIINNEWILTAAHCLVGASPSSITVVAGSTKLSSGGTEHAVKKVFYHEDYDSGRIMNDVGLVKLSQPLEYSPTIQPIQRETQDVGGDEDATLVGWGTTTYPGSVPDNLQYISLKTLTVTNCQERQSPMDVYPSQVCTLTKSGEGACHGDSGGPLVGSEDKQIGIVSWGRPCGIGYPDVFTRVSSFNSWIDDVIAKN